MSKLQGGLMKSERYSLASLRLFQIMDFNDTCDNIERQIIEEQAKIEANGGELIARICVPHIEEASNEFTIAEGLALLDIVGWDKTHNKHTNRFFDYFKST